MVQKYQNEISPIFYYGKSPKTNEKDLKIPNLLPPDWGQPYWMTLYIQSSVPHMKPMGPDGFLMPVRDLDNLHTESIIKWQIADTGWWATWCWTAGRVCPSGWSRPYRCGSPPFWNPCNAIASAPCFLHYRLLLWNLNNSAHNIHSSELKWPGTNNTAIATEPEQMSPTHSV